MKGKVKTEKLKIEIFKMTPLINPLGTNQKDIVGPVYGVRPVKIDETDR